MSESYFQVRAHLGLVGFGDSMTGSEIQVQPRVARDLAWSLLRAADFADKQMPEIDRHEPYEFCVKCSTHFKVAHLCRRLSGGRK